MYSEGKITRKVHPVLIVRTPTPGAQSGRRRKERGGGGWWAEITPSVSILTPSPPPPPIPSSLKRQERSPGTTATALVDRWETRVGVWKQGQGREAMWLRGEGGGGEAEDGKGSEDQKGKEPLILTPHALPLLSDPRDQGEEREGN
ncbi:hypothetical protein NHX12_029114 [Muraenolepis orangiensis]|uniref:Uncharacterized protein n=1 Tax=Muraenolepis orangiensis TaxID=630683 RepID=A0A9Q0EDG1_9TELE|nr:hypothetical protein NHX12_029114 [Muraenolepis orangiensis]